VGVGGRQTELQLGYRKTRKRIVLIEGAMLKTLYRAVSAHVESKMSTDLGKPNQ
jgi:hypothetical protein